MSWWAKKQPVLAEHVAPVWRESRSFFEEFKAFVRRGNVIDLAVGVIIGTAFGKIVSSLVADVIMPIIGYGLGAVDLKTLTFVIRPAEGKEIIVSYGKFLQAVIDFLIIAFCVFVMLKFINRIQGDRKEAPKPPPEEIVLLTEIRDLLQDARPTAPERTP